jgi:hypothetical protein
MASNAQPVPSSATSVANAGFDLRKNQVDDVFDRVERALQVRFDRDEALRKRRSLGLRTDRGTWIRVEVRRLAKIDGQGWNGTECAAILHGIAKPEWHAGISWHDPVREVMWRADETDLVKAEPIKRGGILQVDPHLPDSWWATLDDSLTALASQHTTRVATPDTIPITQTRLTSTIELVFPGRVDTTISDWCPAHADLNWANLTGPDCVLLDWEDWGLAPRGFDSSNLWSNSLAAPGLADRVRDQRRSDLGHRPGRLSSLFYCAEIVGAPAGYSGPLLEPARREAERLITELQR